MEQRDVEMQRLKDLEDRRLQVVLEEYKGRYDRERARLLEALNVTAQCTQRVREILPGCLQLEEQLYGRNTLIPVTVRSINMGSSGQFKLTGSSINQAIQPISGTQIFSQPIISNPGQTTSAERLASGGSATQSSVPVGMLTSFPQGSQK